jgi:hypothetical protein
MCNWWSSYSPIFPRNFEFSRFYYYRTYRRTIDLTGKGECVLTETRHVVAFNFIVNWGLTPWCVWARPRRLKFQHGANQVNWGLTPWCVWACGLQMKPGVMAHFTPWSSWEPESATPPSFILLKQRRGRNQSLESRRPFILLHPVKRWLMVV